MSTVIFDIETDSIFQRGGATMIHCAEALLPDSGEALHFADQTGYRPLADVAALVSDAAILVGHNLLSFDIPMLERTQGVCIERERVIDTLIAARSAWPDQYQRDEDAARIPRKYWGKHSLEAWGYRLNIRKSSFGKGAGDWLFWSPEMQDRCAVDAMITAALYLELLKE